jgi:hypothetical protein
MLARLNKDAKKTNASKQKMLKLIFQSTQFERMNFIK